MVSSFTPPPQSSDASSAFASLLGSSSSATDDGFATDAVPSQSGLGLLQSQFPSERPAYSTRNLMHWLVPEGPIVQMYINPQNVRYNYRKQTSAVRTKGGFTLQYWGEQLTTMTLSGTTGTSGIEGINVLYELYRNEQYSFDPYALYLASALDAQNNSTLSVGSVLGAVSSLVSNTLSALQDPTLASGQNAPTLASLAFAVELYWSGEVYRGFFTEFSVTEAANNLGMFDYEIGFTVTQKRGFRQNFLGWHRSAVDGPSNSNPYYGTPHSFGALTLGDTQQPNRPAPPSIADDILNSFGAGLGLSR